MDDQQYRHFRPPLWTAGPPLLVAIIWLAPLVFHVNGSHVPASLLAIYAALALFNVGFRWWAGLIRTPTHAIVRGLRVQRIRWADIQGVGVQSSFGTEFIALWTADGRAVKPRAPLCSLNIGRGAFIRDYHSIGQWWLAHRGDDWAPTPPH